MLYSQQEIDDLNSIPGMTWTAGIPQGWEDMTMSQFRARLQPRRLPGSFPMPGESLFSEAPAEYDTRKQFPHCVGKIRDQAKCGSCWAFSAVGPFSDRRCIAGLDADRVQYSEEYVVACDKMDHGCNGGSVLFVHQFLKKHGTSTDACNAYKSGTGVTPKCPTTCDDGSALKLTKATGYTLHELDIELFKNEIVKYGPAQGEFFVFEDFKAYTKGIYQHVSGKFLGGHGITVIGWGEENGTPYWIIRNSWGPTWGEDGYFRIMRGTNECGIELVLMGAKVE